MNDSHRIFYRDLLSRMLAKACQGLEEIPLDHHMAIEFAREALAFAGRVEERNPRLAQTLCQSGVKVLERAGVIHRGHVICDLGKEQR